MNRKQYGRILTCFVIIYHRLHHGTAVIEKKHKAMVLRRAADRKCLRNVSVFNG